MAADSETKLFTSIYAIMIASVMIYSLYQLTKTSQNFNAQEMTTIIPDSQVDRVSFGINGVRFFNAAQDEEDSSFTIRYGRSINFDANRYIPLDELFNQDDPNLPDYLKWEGNSKLTISQQDMASFSKGNLLNVSSSVRDSRFAWMCINSLREMDKLSFWRRTAAINMVVFTVSPLITSALLFLAIAHFCKNSQTFELRGYNLFCFVFGLFSLIVLAMSCWEFAITGLFDSFIEKEDLCIANPAYASFTPAVSASSMKQSGDWKQDKDWLGAAILAFIMNLPVFILAIALYKPPPRRITPEEVQEARVAVENFNNDEEDENHAAVAAAQLTNQLRHPGGGGVFNNNNDDDDDDDNNNNDDTGIELQQQTSIVATSAILPQYKEFATANDTICLTTSWIRSSRLHRFTAALSSKQIPVPGNGERFPSQAAEQVIIKAYRIPSYRVHTFREPLANQIVMSQLQNLFTYAKGNLSKSKSRAICSALKILADCGHADELNALVSQVVDRASRCESAKQHGINSLILAAGMIIERRMLSKEAAENNNINQYSPLLEKVMASPHLAHHEQQQPPQEKINNSNTNNNRSNSENQKPTFSRFGESYGFEESNNNNNNSAAPAAAAAFSSSSSSSYVLFSKTLDYQDIVNSHHRLIEIVDDFLDDFKMRAFAGSMLEPAKVFWSLQGDTTRLNDTNIHAINWFLTIVETGLGFGLPISAAAEDDNNASFVDGLSSMEAGFAKRVWENIFTNPQNFGKDASSLLKDVRAEVDASGSRTSDLLKHPHVGRNVERSPRLFGEKLKVDPAKRAEYQKLAEKFAFFFSYEFLVRKLIESCNSELKPEHAGFRNACQRLFEEFQAQGLDTSLAPTSTTYQDFDDFCYNDDLYSELNIDRAAMFFSWLGVVKPFNDSKSQSSTTSVINPATAKGAVWPKHNKFPIFSFDSLSLATQQQQTSTSGMFTRQQSSTTATSTSSPNKSNMMSGLRQSSAEVFDNFCPICLESKNDIEPLQHANDAMIGDTSSHRMCFDCRMKYASKGECPFCREALVSEMFVTEANRFATTMSQVIAGGTSNLPSPMVRAIDVDGANALFESWQLIEMEHSNQKLLERIAYNILRDPRCGGLIIRAAKNKNPVLRHISGLVFRLYALVRDQSERSVLAQLDVETVGGLASAVQLIVSMFEQDAPISARCDPTDWHGHDWAAICNQGLSALLSAQNSGLPTKCLENVTRRLLKAVVKCYNNRLGTAESKREYRRAVHERVLESYLSSARSVLWYGDRDEFSEAFGFK